MPIVQPVVEANRREISGIAIVTTSCMCMRLLASAFFWLRFLFLSYSRRGSQSPVRIPRYDWLPLFDIQTSRHLSTGLFSICHAGLTFVCLFFDVFFLIRKYFYLLLLPSLLLLPPTPLHRLNTRRYQPSVGADRSSSGMRLIMDFSKMSINTWLGCI